jgi:predicted kinase
MAKKKDEEKTKTTHETHTLKCQLTQEELLQHGDELAAALDRLRQVQEESTSVKQEFKARETALEAEIAREQILVRNKYQHRLVDCNLIINYTTQQATLIRLDTEETIKERPLSEEEKQMDLGFDGDKEQAA